MAQQIYGPEHYEAKFDPDAYLNHYYSSDALSDGVRLSLFAMPIFAKQIEAELAETERQTLIDVGSGPTVYSAICFRNVVKQVYLTDFLQKNLNLIQDWIDRRNSFDWKSVAEIVTRVEGNGSLDNIDEVEAQTRSMLSAGGIHRINVHQKTCNLDSSLKSTQFDILVSVFCLESACSSYEQYGKAMKNMLELLRPGGRIILGSVLEERFYNSGNTRLFQLLSLSENQIADELQKNSIDLTTLRKIVLYEEGAIFIMGTKQQIAYS